MSSIYGMTGLVQQMSKEEEEYDLEGGSKAPTSNIYDDDSIENEDNEKKKKLRQQQQQQRGVSFDIEEAQSASQRDIPRKDELFDYVSAGFLRSSVVTRKMGSYKVKAQYAMKQDIYAFIIAAPVMSAPFLFACYVIATKYIVFGCLLWGVRTMDFEGTDGPAIVAKFFLIPVAVAMQEDLMAVYDKIANVQYDPKVLEINAFAKRWKFFLSYSLRFLDGVLSLSANYVTMLKTDDVLGVFLNFAALHFLQDIDDVFYALVERGFFGDKIEHMSLVCKKIFWKRRCGEDNAKFLGCVRISHLDTILYLITYIICLAFYLHLTVGHFRGTAIFLSDFGFNATETISDDVTNE